MSNRIQLKDFYKMEFEASSSKKRSMFDQSITCKLDTGSAVNIIPKGMLNKVEYEDGDRSITVTGATDHKINNVPEVILKRVTIAGEKFKDLGFFVLDSNRNYCLLGIEFIRHVNLSVRSSELSVEFNKLKPSQIKLPLSTDPRVSMSEIILQLNDGADKDELLSSTSGIIDINRIRNNVIQEINKLCKDRVISEVQRIVIISSLYDKFK